MKRLAFFFLAAICATCGADEWVERAVPTYPIGNLSLAARWNPEDGIRLKIAEKTSNRSVVFELDSRKGRVRLYPEEAFPPAIDASSQFQLDALPGTDVKRVLVTMKFRQETWAVYVNDRPVCTLTAPFLPPVVAYQPKSEMVSSRGDDVRYQKTEAHIYKHDDFLKPEEETAELPEWTTWSGTWKLHSAADNSIERESIKADAKARPEFENSPNFYNVRGAGTNACMVMGHEFYDSYSMEAAVETRPGEMGIVFHARNPGGFFAFTLRQPEAGNEVRLHLWKTAQSNAAERTVLAAVETETTPRQWVKLRAVTFQNRVQCFMDQVKVIDMPVELPVGGQFGLFVNGTNGTLFDDVTAEANHDLDFLTLNDLRRYTLEEDGQFFPRRRFFKLFAPRDIGQTLEVPSSAAAQQLVLGSFAHTTHVFSATFDADGSRPGSAGLLTGCTPDGNRYRFIRGWTPTNTVFMLVGASGTNHSLLESFGLARTTSPPREVFTLLSDATEQGQLRLYCDGRLVLIHHMPNAPAGASGLYVGPATTASISAPDYRFRRKDVYRNRFEKNRQYVEDPYMRHWSSPEGQWIQMTNSLVWHKGDLFGRFMVYLPWITNTEVHVGIGETTSNGAFVVRAANGSLTLRDSSGATLATVPTNLIHREIPETVLNKTNAVPEPWYSLHYEDHWMWATSGTNLLFKQSLQAPLAGRRMRISGFTTEQLKHSLVEAYNVKDSLFTESLHEWTQNGGLWDVVNRFMCQPKWSHMNGESRTDLAAIWNKFLYKGDFCVEMHVGTRHGWYQRTGDFNVSILSRQTSPGQGYTVTCGGWDNDNSQMYTRLYRNGALLAVSDKYLVPRQREGARRLYIDPLLPAGRDVHGAWYYVKFRKVGKKLEYSFDNEPVFSIEDPDPLVQGRLGVWTYMNSMMVARVRVSAEKIEPLPFPFKVVPPDSPEAKPSYPASAAICRYAIKDGCPLMMMLPEMWTVEDTVGRSVLHWHEAAGKGPYFELRNSLGSGPMTARPLTALVPYPVFAGWRFEVKRTVGARFNFNYSAGRIQPEKGYQPERFFFHRITGADFPGRQYLQTGATDVPASAVTGMNWHAAGQWTPVTVWLPADELKGFIADTGLLIRAEGFGNLQPSFVAEGLEGNAPGEAYAVRNFTEIRMAPPVLTPSNAAARPDAIHVLSEDMKTILTRARDIEPVQTWATALTNTGLIEANVVMAGQGATVCQDIAWIRLPVSFPVACTWSRAIPDAVVVAAPLPYPERRFDTASVVFGSGTTETLQWTGLVRRTMSVLRYDPPREIDGLNRFTVRIPMPETLVRQNPDFLPVSIRSGTNSWDFKLQWKERPAAGGPVLLAVRGNSLFHESFELQSFPPELARSQGMVIRGPDSRHGYYLTVDNAGQQQRLNTRFTFPVAMEVPRFPLVQFRYRATGMAFITLSLDQRMDARLSEEFGQAVAVRAPLPFQLDGQWRTWQGFASDACRNQPLTTRKFAAQNVSFGSRNGADRTGLFTKWDFDELTIGPAVSRNEQLAFAPWYSDADGVKQVFMALHAGWTAHDDLSPDDAKAIKWAEIPNEKSTVPDIKTLPEGPCQLFLKAIDTTGMESTVASFPFLVDRLPLESQCAFIATNGPAWNASALQVTVKNGGGAPVDLAGVCFQWNDKKVPLPDPLGSVFDHSAERDSFFLNWPHMFREQLNQTEDGDTNIVVVSGLQDGAGNASPDLRIPWVTDYESDTNPPTLLDPVLPSNILWCSGWEIGEGRQPQFIPLHGGKMELTRKPGEEPYLAVDAVKNNASVAFRPGNIKWYIDEYPLLAFRIRRPNLMPKDSAQIDLVIDFGAPNTFVIPLAEPGKKKNKKKLYLAEPIPWRSNTWHSVMLDLSSFLRQNVETGKLDVILGTNPHGRETDPEKRKKMLPVKEMALRMQNAKDSGPVHLQSVFVFAPFRSNDTVRMNAFDVSGMAGVTWECEKIASTSDISPANLALQDHESGWILLRNRDKAGNLSIPFRFPLFRTPPAAQSNATAAATQGK